MTSNTTSGQTPETPWPSRTMKRIPATPVIPEADKGIFSALKEMERGKLILLSLFLLGVFSLMAGLGLIIASNWNMIPPLAKVGGGAVILIGLLLVSCIAWERKKLFLLEIGLFASFLMIGANIGLIQQTYHLNITFQEGALIWSAIGLPIIFFSAKPLLLLMWCGLMTFGCWEIIERLFTGRAYIPAGIFFLIYLLSFLFNRRPVEKIRWMFFLAMFLILLAGDLGLTASKSSVIGFITTIGTLIFLTIEKENKKRVSVGFLNILFLFVAWRIVLLFWTAYANLFSMGIILLVFGAAILGIASLLYLQKDRWETFVKGLINEK